MRTRVAVLAGALVLAGCGGDDGGEGPEAVAVSPTLALASDLSDLYTRALATLEDLATAEDEAGRTKASETLEGIGRDADRLAGEARSVQGQAREIARNASCLVDVLAAFRSAAGSVLGEEAQAGAEAAADDLRACFGDLRRLLAGLRSESADSAKALIARAGALEGDLESLLPDLVASLAAVEPVVEEPAVEESANPSGLPECDGSNFPCFNSLTGQVQEAEVSDLPQCGEAEPPCQFEGEPVLP